mmetsp:Transcript_98963/g.255860  ORF Transcript_98963/g.255860 Transcript_98963/m.255860 type:complete len:81 (+) Transcript_98963:1-243(+)
MRALFGWQDQPTPVEFFAYVLYWITVSIVGYIVVQRAKKQLEQLIKMWEVMDQQDAAAAGLPDTPKEISNTVTVGAITEE